jgi:hypothetical protein
VLLPLVLDFGASVAQEGAKLVRCYRYICCRAAEDICHPCAWPFFAGSSSRCRSLPPMLSVLQASTCHCHSMDMCMELTTWRAALHHCRLLTCVPPGTCARPAAGPSAAYCSAALQQSDHYPGRLGSSHPASRQAHALQPLPLCSNGFGSVQCSVMYACQKSRHHTARKQ